jgi:hypothetical protein
VDKITFSINDSSTLKTADFADHSSAEAKAKEQAEAFSKAIENIRNSSSGNIPISAPTEKEIYKTLFADYIGEKEEKISITVGRHITAYTITALAPKPDSKEIEVTPASMDAMTAAMNAAAEEGKKIKDSYNQSHYDNQEKVDLAIQGKLKESLGGISR